MDPQPTPPQKPKEHFLKEIVQFTLIAIIIVLPIRLFVAQPFIVSGTSMVPTFDDGNYLIVDEISYRFEKPQRGDVIVFKFPYDEKRFLIKRIIGLPGETVTIKDATTTITNAKHKDGFVLKEPYIESGHNTLYGNLTITLDKDHYFVMGDNRVASSDSRVWGPLDKSLIVGRPFLRLLPIERLGALPGVYHLY